MRAGTGEFSFVNDQVFVADRLAAQERFEDFTRPRRVARLRRQRCTGDMRCHAVVRHGAPGMILRGRLREPDVARIACELPALERPHYGIALADLAARRIDDIGAPLHL